MPPVTSFSIVSVSIAAAAIKPHFQQKAADISQPFGIIDSSLALDAANLGRVLPLLALPTGLDHTR